MKRKTKLLLNAGLSSTMILSGLAITNVSAQEPYQPGVTVEENTNDDYVADYQVSFVYEDQDEKDAVSVSVSGNLQFYAKDEITNNYAQTAISKGAIVYDAYEYQEGMFNTGYGLNGDSVNYQLTETSDERFEITLPLPGNLYYYDYTVTYADGTKVTIQDPANPSIKNAYNGHDAGHSLVYVGTGDNTTAGQEYIYERNDQNGIYSFVTYTAVDGSMQPLGVYLPYNYDQNKTYPTLYVSHGGGGNEAEWMTIGALPNIMDNLIAEGEMAEAIVVTMDNSYFNWDYDVIAKNFKECIIPYMEENYNSAKEVENRALCGLSMGALTTGTIMFTYTDMFDYYGCFSGTADPLLCQDLDLLKTKNIYLTGGNVDMAIQAEADAEDSGFNRGKTVRAHEYLLSQGVEHLYDLKDGAHDWGVWRDALTTFAKECLWDKQTVEPSTYPSGVSVEANKDDRYVADYQVSFVYEDQDEKDAVSVSVSGNLQFYAKDEITNNFINTGSATDARVYNAYEYQEGMFNTGYGLNGDSVNYQLTETSDERFEITLPLPGNLYYYDYTVTYADGTKVTIQDPANPSIKNAYNGHDAGHSLVYVGNGDNTTAGQEYIYERNGQNGNYSFVTYTAVDGSMQPLGVYLPYNYDENKTYKTIYVSHGGGGNEAEWMTIGALPNIMDNLIAEGEVVEAIVVTMDNTYFNWDYDVIAKNFKECIIPYIEKNYSVSNEANDRALCGLSMGSMTTTTILQAYTDMFGYYGCFSGANVPVAVTDLEALKNVTIYLTAGSVDMALKDANGDESRKTVGLAAKLDDLKVSYGMDIKYGAHDWGVWRDAYTTFVKDYLWNQEDNTTVVDPDVNKDNTIDKTTTSVKTGDDQSLVLYGMVIVVSAMTLSYINKKRKVN